jgi:hypothetical protein
MRKLSEKEFQRLFYKTEFPTFHATTDINNRDQINSRAIRFNLVQIRGQGR